MKQITVDTFKKEVMQNQRPVILEFHGSFCSACANVEKLLEEAQVRYGCQIDFLCVDADHEEMINTALQVYELPALFFIKNGHLVFRHNGFMPADELQQAIDHLLKA